MRELAKVLSCFCLGFLLVPAGWAQSTFNPSKDNTIFSNDTDGSNGAGSRLFVGTTSGTISGSQRRALLRFDVSSIPAGSTVTSATLTLTQVSATPPTSTTSTVAAHRLLVDFGEGASTATGAGLGIPATAIPPDATWTHRITTTNSTTGTAWGAGGGLAGTDFVGAATGTDSDGSGTAVMTVTSDVQAWVNGTANNFGWILLGSTTNGSVRGYGSRENATVSVRPVLSVSFLTPVDLTVSKSDAVDPVLPNSPITYTISVTNNGQSTATGTITVNENLDDNTTFVSASGTGWTCGSGDTFTCTRTADLSGSTTTPAITVVATAPGTATTVTNNVSVSTPDTESNTGNNSDSETTTIASGADLSITKTESADPVEIGTQLVYTITATNAGPDTATTVAFVDNLPSALVSPVVDDLASSFTCNLSVTTVLCELASMPVGSQVVTIMGTAPATPQQLSNSVNIASATLDPNSANNTPPAVLTDVVSQANLSVTKAVSSPSGGFTKGSAVVYTVTITNSGPHAQLDNAGDEFTDTLPTSLENVSASIVSGGGTLGGSGNTVTWNGTIAANASVVIQIDATISDTVSAGDDISNQATVNFDPDGDGTSESSATSDDPDTAAANDPTAFVVAAFIAAVPTASTAGLLLLMLLLGGAATVLLRR